MLGRVYRNLGVVLGRMWRAGPGNYSDPIKSEGDNYTRKAAMLAKKHIDIYGYEVAMSNMINTFTYFSKDIEDVSDSAHFYADQMIQFGKDNNNIQIEARAYIQLSYFYNYNDDLSESKYYARKAFQLSDNINNMFSDIGDYTNLENMKLNLRGLGVGINDILISVGLVAFMECYNLYERSGNVWGKLEAKPRWIRWGIYYILLFGILFLAPYSRVSNFIYFQF